MNLQKKILAAAVGVALFSSANIAAAAPANLDASGSFSYSSELLSKASQTIAPGTNNDCDLTSAAGGFEFKAGTLLPVSTTAVRNIRIDLVGGKFTAAAFPKLIHGATQTNSGTLVSSVVQGGQATDSYVILSVVVSAGNIEQADTVILGLEGGVVLDSGITQLGLKYSVYVEADNAANSTDALYSKTYNAAIKSVAGASIAIKDSKSDEIDPAKDTLFVDAIEETDLSSFTAAAATVSSGVGVCAPADGTKTAAALDKAGKLVVSGNFSAFKTSPGDVFLHSDSDCKSGTTTAVGAVIDASATTATFTFTSTANQELDANLNTKFLCVKADKVTSMVAGNYECKIEYKVGASDTITSGPTACGNLAFAGSSDRVNFGAEPGGAFQQFYRMSNPSSQAGAVVLTVTNDAGKSVTLNLSDLSSISSNDLAAGASTPLISNTEIYTAATTKDATFNHNGGKLRLVARGNFGDDIESGTSTFGEANSTDGIILEAIAISGTGAATHVQ